MKQIKNVFMTMWRYAKSVLIGKIFIVVITSILVPVNALLLQNLVDCMIGLYKNTSTLQPVLLWTVLLCGFVLLEVILSALSQLLDVKCDQKLVDNLESALIEKYIRLDYMNYEDKDTQNLIHRMSDQPYMRIKNLFLQMLGAVQIIITLIGLTAVYAKVSPMLVFLTFLLVIPMIWASCDASRLWWDLYARQSSEERQLNYLDTILTSKIALFELKVYRALQYIVRLWNKKTQSMMAQKFKVQKQSQKRIHLQSLLSVIWYGIFIIIMLTGFLRGNITLGLFVSLISISLPAINALTELAGNFGVLAQEIMEMDYYHQFMELPEYTQVKDFEGDILPEIVFEKVTFTYPNSSVPVLKGASFRIQPRESVGIVGVNGAGKSTIFQKLADSFFVNSRVHIETTMLYKMNIELSRKCYKIPLIRYEIPEFQDSLNRARDCLRHTRLTDINLSLLNILSELFRVASVLVILASFSVYLIPISVLSILPFLIIRIIRGNQFYELRWFQAGKEKKKLFVSIV